MGTVGLLVSTVVEQVIDLGSSGGSSGCTSVGALVKCWSNRGGCCELVIEYVEWR